MKKLIHANLYLLLRKKEYWFSLFVMFAFVCITYLLEVKNSIGKDLFCLGGPSYHFVLNIWGEYISYFMIFFPILLGIFASFPAFDENKNKTVIFSIVRNNKKKVYFSKWIVSFIGGSSIMLAPLLLNIVLNVITFRNAGVHQEGVYHSEMYFLKRGYAFENWYKTHEIPYEILFVFAIALFAGICSMFSFAACNFIKHYKILTVLPIYIVFFISDALNFKSFNFQDYLLCPCLEGNFLPAIFVAVIMLVSSGFMINIFVDRMECW